MKPSLENGFIKTSFVREKGISGLTDGRDPQVYYVRNLVQSPKLLEGTLVQATMIVLSPANSER